MRPVELVALGLVALLLLTMPVFAIVSRGRALDADVARRPTTIILGSWIRDWLMWLIAPVEKGMVRAGVSPDALNLTGVALSERKAALEELCQSLPEASPIRYSQHMEEGDARTIG